MTTGKTTALIKKTFVGKVMSLLLNMLSRLVITFLPRSKHLWISWLQSPSAVILEPPQNKLWHCFHCFPIYFPLKVKSLSCFWLFATPWTIAYQAPPSVGFSRQEYWSGLPFPSPGDLPNTGIEPGSPALQADALPSEPPGKPLLVYKNTINFWMLQHCLIYLLILAFFVYLFLRGHYMVYK